jgi:hypothetical protein
MRKLLLPAVCCVFPVLSAHAQNDGTRKSAPTAVIARTEGVRQEAPTKVVPERFGRLVAVDAAAQSDVPVAQPPAKRRQALNDAALTGESALAEHCESEMDDASLRELVTRETASVGVDEKLALTILALESNDGASLNSRKGARGPMQLMPDTATQYGVRDICNPAENVRGAMLFLRDLSAQFGGNLMLIAAAYNAGPERVYQSRGVPAIAETVRYVANATNKYYGLEGASTRHGGGVAQQSRFHAPSVQETSERPKVDLKGQQWIGGSVLYVSSDNDGEAK